MEPKKLYRNPSEGMLGGVCAGLSEHLVIDLTIIRLVFVLLLFGGGSGLWIYLIMWLMVPEKPDDI